MSKIVTNGETLESRISKRYKTKDEKNQIQCNYEHHSWPVIHLGYGAFGIFRFSIHHTHPERNDGLMVTGPRFSELMEDLITTIV